MMDGTTPQPPPIKGITVDQAELETKVAQLEARVAELESGDKAEEAAETPAPVTGPEHTRLDDLLVTAEDATKKADEALATAEADEKKIKDEIAALPAGA